MLSMIISVFLSRGGLDMPDTVAELYSIASQALLERVDHKERGAATATAAVPHLTRLLQRIFFEAHVAQRRVIEDYQLDEAALGLEAPEVLRQIRERAMQHAPFEPFDGRAENGHYVEVVKGLQWGRRKGKRGVIIHDDKTSNPYKVRFADGEESGWLEPTDLKSSGLDETTFLRHAMPMSAKALREACKELSAETCDALRAVRERVCQDRLPLLSLLQVAPLQLQSSHLSESDRRRTRSL